MPYLTTGSRPDTTARIYVRPAAPADDTVVLDLAAFDPPRPAEYRGRHRRPKRGTPRVVTAAVVVVALAFVMVVGFDAMLGMVGR